MIGNERLIAGVLGVAFNGKGEVLLTQRHEPDVPKEHEKWQLPGGALEFGEHPEGTLRREIKEELNVEAKIISPGPIIRSLTFEKKQPDGEITPYHLLMFAYIITLANTNIDISSDTETSAFTWASVDSIDTLTTLPLVPDIVAEATQRLNNPRQMVRKSITEK